MPWALERQAANAAKEPNKELNGRKGRKKPTGNLPMKAPPLAVQILRSFRTTFLVLCALCGQLSSDLC
jgi:hypothetical protein